MSTTYRGELRGEGLRIGIVVSRFNETITTRLLEGAAVELQKHGVDESSVTIAYVPGAFEIPVAAQRLAKSGTCDAVVCLGAVIRGETAHYELVANGCAQGIQRVQLDTGTPVLMGVATTENYEQALARSAKDGANLGSNAVLAAIEMVDLLRRLPKQPRQLA